MAVNLKDKPNTEPVSATYPYGNIKDNTGGGDGTPVDVEVYADFHQLFARMLAIFEADGFGTVNGLPDNNTNGFQYDDAFRVMARLSNRALMASLAQTFIGNSYSNSIPYALTGAEDDGSTISFGFILFNQRLYYSFPFNYGVVTNALQFNETLEDTLTITDSATPGLFEYGDIVILHDSRHGVGDVGEPAFQNSWVNENTAVYNGLSFRKYNNNEVKFEGQISGGATSTVIFTLPVGYRPLKTINMPVLMDDITQVGRLIFNPTGDVVVSFNVGTKISFDGVVLRLD